MFEFDANLASTSHKTPKLLFIICCSPIHPTTPFPLKMIFVALSVYLHATLPKYLLLCRRSPAHARDVTPFSADYLCLGRKHKKTPEPFYFWNMLSVKFFFPFYSTFYYSCIFFFTCRHLSCVYLCFFNFVLSL